MKPRSEGFLIPKLIALLLLVFKLKRQKMFQLNSNHVCEKKMLSYYYGKNKKKKSKSI